MIGEGQGSGLTARVIGRKGGEEGHSNTASENGPHTHSLPIAYPVNAGTSFEAIKQNYQIANQTSGSSGSGAVHNTMMPYFVGNWIVKT